MEGVNRGQGEFVGKGLLFLNGSVPVKLGNKGFKRSYSDSILLAQDPPKLLSKIKKSKTCFNLLALEETESSVETVFKSFPICTSVNDSGALGVKKKDVSNELEGVSSIPSEKGSLNNDSNEVVFKRSDNVEDENKKTESEEKRDLDPDEPPIF